MRRAPEAGQRLPAAPCRLDRITRFRQRCFKHLEHVRVVVHAQQPCFRSFHETTGKARSALGQAPPHAEGFGSASCVADCRIKRSPRVSLGRSRRRGCTPAPGAMFCFAEAPQEAKPEESQSVTLRFAGGAPGSVAISELPDMFRTITLSALLITPSVFTSERKLVASAN